MDKDFPKTFRFGEENGLNQFSYERIENLNSEIVQEDPEYIAQIDESEYLRYLLEKYSITIPSLQFDQMSTWETTRLVPAEWFPSGRFMVEDGQKYEKRVIIYRIPFHGNADLFKFKSDESTITYGGSHASTYTENNFLCFELINWFDNLQQIKESANKQLGIIREKYTQLAQKITEFNYGLEWKAKNAIEQRKNRITNLLEILGVPVKKVSDIPDVFSTNEDKQQSVVIKPSLTGENVETEYVLSEENYFDILQKIHDIGKNFERYPSTHEGKKEEDLRDFIITFLQPQYKLAITGETFNKKGKTDILMRYQNTNVFVAECKFWQGKEGFLKTISQLLSYLTWRDSKAAVIMFVKRKDFSSILKTAKSSITEHHNYVGYTDEREETWSNYEFHLDNDEERKVKLAILMFNLEEPSNS